MAKGRTKVVPGLEPDSTPWRVGRSAPCVQGSVLQTVQAPLVQVIRDQIDAGGPMTFAAFMEQALYHPTLGYYSSGRCSIGRRGDYYTSVSVGPLFGRLLAAQFAELWTALGRPDGFTIVEQGAHDGTFARDVLEAARQHHPDFFAAIRYAVIEPFPILRARQEEKLSAFARQLSWHNSLEELPPFRGVHFSNELLDALPVHLVRWNGDEWLERRVINDGETFAFVDLPLSSAGLAERIREIPTSLAAGYETEVNLLAIDWVASLAAKLTQGFMLIADYGFARDEFYAPHRSSGTLRSFSQHRAHRSPLERPGEADITAHVEWTSLAECAEANDLTIAGFADQNHFITGLLAGDLGAEFGPNSDEKSRRALQTLLHPQHLGMSFQFLALSKAIDPLPALAGFRFARDPRAALGLTADPQT
jgi:SAM-dependent MidA family methyltransferase